MKSVFIILCFWVSVNHANGQTIGQACTQRQHNGITTWVRTNENNRAKTVLCATLFDGENKTNWYADINGVEGDPPVFSSREDAVNYITAHDVIDPASQQKP